MAYQSIHTGSDIDTGITNIQQIFNLIYPVGSYYMSSSATNPGTLFGGTWEQITDRMIMAAGSSYAAGTTGGATSHTHTSAAHTHTSAAHTHTTAGHTLTVNEMPSHAHQLRRQQWYSADTVHSAMTGSIYSWKSGEGKGGSTSYSWTNDAGQDVLYTGGGASHSHGNTGLTTPGNTGSTTPGNTGSSSNLPPYIVAYIWRRTA